MRTGLSLLPRILLWFVLTVAAMVLLAVGVFHFQLHLSPVSPLRALSAEGLESVARIIEQDLNRADSSEWDAVLAHRSEAYGVQFVLADGHGLYLAGDRVELPERVLDNMPGSTDAFWRGLPAATGRRDAPPARFVVRSDDPVRYWGAAPVLLEAVRGGPYARAVLIAVSDRRDGYGLFSDVRPLLAAGAVLLLVSLLTWIPLVRSLARPIVRMTAVTEQIARGEFDARVDANRSDEIGRLGAAINDMTARLGHMVRGQRRFLAVAAHELSSPIARLDMALGVLRQGGEDAEQTIDDISEDVEHMASLVQELLLYASADQDPSQVLLEPVRLLPAIERVVRRECVEETGIDIEIDGSVTVLANPQLLSRAVGNLLRNSMRYAVGSPISIRARRRGERVLLEVLDEGPGVPEDALEHLFDPFYRPDDSRVAETGGAGLGLAIVRTCVEVCGGHVTARNLEPHGLAVVMEFRTEQERSVA